MKKIQIVLVYLVVTTFVSGQSPHGDGDPLTENFTPEQKQALKDYLNEGIESKENFIAPDFSNVTTEALVERVLSASMGRGLDYPFLLEELKTRPSELKKVIRAKSAVIIPKHKLGNYIGEIRGLPELAIVVSQEFQIEMAKKSLERKGLPKDLGQRFRSHDYLFNILKKSQHDETPVLDKLIKEGVITKGSEFDQKWRVLLQKNAEKNEDNKFESGNDKQPLEQEHIAPEKDDKGKPQEISDSPATPSENKTIPHNQLEADSNKPRRIDKESSLPWIIGGLLVLSIVGFVFIKNKK